MNEKEKQIEEMAKIIENAITETSSEKAPANASEARCEAKALYFAGYRKQSEVAENIIKMLKAAKPVAKVHFEAYDELIENIATEYGVEVEK